jgi:hypothetical protein
MVSRLSRAFILSAFALTLLGGCYEGVKKGSLGPGAGGGGGGTGKTDGPSAKKIGGALLDFIYLSEEAMRSPSCYSAPSSLIEFRRQEITERQKQLTALIKANADEVRVIRTEISLKDCTSGLTALSERASKPVDDFSIEGDALGKPFLHLKVVFWDDDRLQVHPDAAVLSDDWAEVRTLRGTGLKKILVAYEFYLSGWREGYFSEWRRLMPWDRTHRPQVISWPDVSAEGWTQAMKTITSSTQDFWTWLEPRINAL